MLALRAIFLVLAAICAAAIAVAQNVATAQYTNARTGVQNQESLLTPSAVNSSSFGKLFSFPVSGHVYAQPLYMSGLTMADGKTHNVLFVATEQDYLYAFDADGNNPAQGYLWQDLLADPGETFVSYSDINNGDIYPDIGITGTPVIDPSTGTLYVVAKSKTSAAPVQFYQRLHAINLADGTEKFNGPTVIQATVAGNADGSSTISFDPFLGNQRAGLLLAPTLAGSSPASVFIAFASHGDQGPYHGWLISYSASDISQQSGVWCDTPNGAEGGIWQAGGALSSDGNGNLFAGTGNGTFDINTGGVDYGNSAVAFTMNSTGLALTSYYTPTDQNGLVNNDMGTSSVVLLPPQTGPIPHLAVVAEKHGYLHLLNTDNLGGYLGSSTDTSVQTFNIGTNILGNPSFFNNTLYLAGQGGPLSAWAFDPVAQLFSTTPASSTTQTFGCDRCGGSGASPVVSANGTANAIVWALDNSGTENSPAILRAYDALNLQNVLYSSDQAPNNRDSAAIAVKFTTPVVVNGHVYVGGINAVTVYGELATVPTVSITANPASITQGSSSTLTVSGSHVSSITITGTDGSSFTFPATGGTQPVTPSNTTTYTASGITTGGTSITATATVTVTANAGCLPSSPGISICAPTNNLITGTSVTITAGALAPSGHISAIRAYIDTVAVFTLNNPSPTSSMQVTQTVNVAAGTHQLDVVGYSTNGSYVKSSTEFTAGATSAGCLPSSPGVSICSPANNANTGTSVTITAGALAASGHISAIRAYIDTVAAFTVNNPFVANSMQVTQAVTVAPGIHRLDMVGYPTSGGYVKSSTSFTASGATH